jgi:hypothetical protein
MLTAAHRSPIPVPGLPEIPALHPARRNAPHRASAVSAPKIGPNGFGPVPRARIAAIFDKSKTPKLKFLDKLIAEHHAVIVRRDARQTKAEELSGLVSALKEKAETEQWSGRELASKIGFPWSTWHRISAGRVNAADYLPKLRSAALRILKGANP